MSGYTGGRVLAAVSAVMASLGNAASGAEVVARELGQSIDGVARAGRDRRPGPRGVPGAKLARKAREHKLGRGKF